MKAARAAGFLLFALSGAVFIFIFIFTSEVFAGEPVAVKIRDLTSVEGVRENPLIGYGMVVGLTQTGDSQQTVFTTQTLANIMQRMGAQIPPATAIVKNVAAVFVTASLPAFARPGTQVDVTVSSIGDAKSLEGGVLLLTPLYGADGQVYAAAQGPIAVGGFAAGGAGATKQMNHPTTGRVPAGGRVERSLTFDFNRLAPVSLLLRESDFSTAGEISDAINREFGHAVASARDGGRVEVDAGGNRRGEPDGGPRSHREFDRTRAPARPGRAQRTYGNHCDGKRRASRSGVHSARRILGADLRPSIPFPSRRRSRAGKTEVVANTEVQAKDSPAKRLEIGEGASIDELVGGLHNMGATARDVISILQAIKAAGALDADLEVI